MNSYQHCKKSGMFLLLLAVLLLSLSVSGLCAEEITVPPGGSIQNAINSASSGDIIVLTAGTVAEPEYYFESNIEFSQAGAAVKALTITTDAADKDPRKVIIRSNQAGNSTFYIHNKETKSSVISNVTIESNPSFSGNGGAFHFRNESELMVRDCIIQNSRADDGAAAYIQEESNPTFFNCKFLNNRANDDGGAIFITNNSTAMFQNCLMKGNRCDGGDICGSAVKMMGEVSLSGCDLVVETAYATLVNCTIVDNNPGGSSVPIHNVNPSLPVNIMNCIMDNNGSNKHIESSNAGLIESIAGLAGTMKDASVFNSCITGGEKNYDCYMGDENHPAMCSDNITDDPQFVDRVDYRLNMNSPCIGKAAPGPSTDDQYEPRPYFLSPGYDIGLDEFNFCYLVENTAAGTYWFDVTAATTGDYRVDTRTTGTTFQSGQTRFYKINLPPEAPVGTLRIWSTGENDLIGTLFSDCNGTNIIGTDDNSFDGKNFKIDYLYADSNNYQYYLAVKNKSTTSASYNLYIQLQTDPEDNFCSTVVSEALTVFDKTILTEGYQQETISGLINYSDDIDNHKIEFGQPGTIKVQTSNTDIEILLKNTECNIVAEAEPTYSDDTKSGQRIIYDNIDFNKLYLAVQNPKIVENIVTNPNLDTGWDKSACASIEWNNEANGGTPPNGVDSQVVSFYDADTDQSGSWQSYGDYAPQEPGETYTVSLYVKTADSNFRISFYTADDSETGRHTSEEKTVPNDGQWHRIVWDSFENPENSQSDSLSFSFKYGNSQGVDQRTWLCWPQMGKSSGAIQNDYTLKVDYYPSDDRYDVVTGVIQPVNWTPAAVATTGEFSYDPSTGEYLVLGNGSGLDDGDNDAGTADLDEFFYTYKEIAGDFSFIVRLMELETAETSFYKESAGLMIRSSLSQDARNIFTAANPKDCTGLDCTETSDKQKFSTRWRIKDGIDSEQTPKVDYGNNTGYLTWLNLTREGNSYQSSSGDDGTTWSNTTRMSMLDIGSMIANRAKTGLAVSSYNTVPDYAFIDNGPCGDAQCYYKARLRHYGSQDTKPRAIYVTYTGYASNLSYKCISPFHYAGEENRPRIYKIDAAYRPYYDGNYYPALGAVTANGYECMRTYKTGEEALENMPRQIYVNLPGIDDNSYRVSQDHISEDTPESKPRIVAVSIPGTLDTYYACIKSNINTPVSNTDYWVAQPFDVIDGDGCDDDIGADSIFPHWNNSTYYGPVNQTYWSAVAYNASYPAWVPSNIYGSGWQNHWREVAGNDNYEPLSLIQPDNKISLGKPTTQSSYYNGDTSIGNRATDGNTSGLWSDNSVAHTENTATTYGGPWWQVDLGGKAKIGTIKIYNRTDSCCTARLHDFYVCISDNPINGNYSAASWSTFHAGTLSDSSISFDAGGASGRYVMVMLDEGGGSNDSINIAEVEVYTNSDTTFLTETLGQGWNHWRPAVYDSGFPIWTDTNNSAYGTKWTQYWKEVNGSTEVGTETIADKAKEWTEGTEYETSQSTKATFDIVDVDSQDIVLNKASIVNTSASGPVNLTRIGGSEATQSSDALASTTADKAIDGNLSTINHTNQEMNAWLQVDLKQVYTIGNIKIYNRLNEPWADHEYNQPDLIGSRLDDIYVFISGSSMATTGSPAPDIQTLRDDPDIWEYYHKDSGPLIDIDVSEGFNGQYVLVILGDSINPDIVHIREIEIYNLVKSYACIQNTSSIEPGVSNNWEQYWKVLPDYCSEYPLWESGKEYSTDGITNYNNVLFYEGAEEGHTTIRPGNVNADFDLFEFKITEPGNLTAKTTGCAVGEESEISIFNELGEQYFTKGETITGTGNYEITGASVSGDDNASLMLTPGTYYAKVAPLDNHSTPFDYSIYLKSTNVDDDIPDHLELAKILTKWQAYEAEKPRLYFHRENANVLATTDKDFFRFDVPSATDYPEGGWIRIMVDHAVSSTPVKARLLDSAGNELAASDDIRMANPYYPVYRDIWDKDIDYTSGTQICHEGLYYSCLSDTNAGEKPGVSGKWSAILIDSVFNVTWDSGRTYNTKDIVLHSGNYYRCTADNTSGATHTPGSSGSWAELSAPPNANSAMIEKRLDNGTYYIEITADIPVDYELAVDFDDFGSSHQTVMPFDGYNTIKAHFETVKGTISDWSYDDDGFELIVTKDMSLTISSLGDSDTFGVLKNASGGTEASDNDSGEGKNFLFSVSLTPGTYYIHTCMADTTQIGDYQIQISQTDDFVNSERSCGVTINGSDIDWDCEAPAQPPIMGELTSGSSISGVVSTPGDIDMFKFQPVEAGRLTIESSGTLDTQGSLYIYNPITRLARMVAVDSSGSGDSVGNFQLTYDVSPGTTYLLKVKAEYTKLTGRYEISTTINTNPSSYNKDDDGANGSGGDSYLEARDISMAEFPAGSGLWRGDYQSGGIDYEGDVDFYYFALPGEGALTVYTQDVAPPAWESSSTYYEGNIVSHNTVFYQWKSTTSGNTEPPSDDWEIVAEPRIDTFGYLYQYINGMYTKVAMNDDSEYDDDDGLNFGIKHYVNPVNLALGKPSTQSSTLNAPEYVIEAASANDGNLSTTNHTDNHAADTEKTPWWQVDLGSMYTINEIKIFNRTDEPGRLQNFHIFISETDMAGTPLATLSGDSNIWEFSRESACDVEESFSISDGTPDDLSFNGRYVMVMIDGSTIADENRYLHMREVEVLGTPEFFVKVKNFSNSDTGNYAFFVNFDDSEKDDHGDDCRTATSVGPAMDHAGRIGIPGDIDFFKFVLGPVSGSGGTLKANTLDNDLDPFGYLKNSLCSNMLMDDNGAGINEDFLLTWTQPCDPAVDCDDDPINCCRPEVFNVAVRNYDNTETGPYKLNIESNGTFVDWQGFATWTPSDGNAHYFGFEIPPTGSSLEVIANNAAGTLGIEILSGVDGTVVDGDPSYFVDLTDPDKTDYFRLNRANLSPGTYYAKITPAASSLNSYQMNVGSWRWSQGKTSNGSGTLVAGDADSVNFTITATGEDYWDGYDDGFMIFRTVTGDFDMSARVYLKNAPNPWTKGGIMARPSLADGARNIFSLYSRDNGYQSQETVSGTSTRENINDSRYSYVRMTRNGDTITTYTSTSGEKGDWREVATYTMAGEIIVGMAATSHDPNNSCTVEFQYVKFATEVTDN